MIFKELQHAEFDMEGAAGWGNQGFCSMVQDEKSCLIGQKCWYFSQSENLNDTDQAAVG